MMVKSLRVSTNEYASTMGNRILSRKILWQGQEVGICFYQPLRCLTVRILDDLTDDECEIMYPLFFDYQAQDGYYVHNLTLYEGLLIEGKEQEIMKNFVNGMTSPILTCGLPYEKSFLTSIGLKSMESDYYGWSPEDN